MCERVALYGYAGRCDQIACRCDQMAGCEQVVASYKCMRYKIVVRYKCMSYKIVVRYKCIEL